MKHFSRLVLGILVPWLSLSCAQEKENPSYSNTPEVLVPMEFNAGSAALKSTISGLSIRWESGDKMSVFDGSGNRSFSTTNSGSIARFKGLAAETETYILLYPFNSSATCADGTISTVIPTEQFGKKDRFARGSNLSVGIYTTGDEGVTMKNAGALVSLTIPSGDTKVRKIKIEALDDTPLSGDVSIATGTGTPVTTGGSETANYVLLKAGAGLFSPGEYFAPVIPGTCEDGIRVSLILDSGDILYKENSNPAVFERNGILDLGTLNVASFTFLSSDTANDDSADPVSSFSSYGVDFSTLEGMGHPRLFMTEEDFENLKHRVVEDYDPSDYMYKFHRAALARAAALTTKSSPVKYYIDENGNLLDECDEGMKRLIAFAYGYRLTGEEIYLEMARDLLNTVCNFPDWYPSDMMCPSEMSTGVAVAYDWLYKYLSKEERQMIEDALHDFELVPFSGYKPREDSNWNQSTCGAATMTAIVLYEKYRDLCGTIIDKAVTSNKKAVRNIFYPHGAGKEGPGYTNYTLSFESCLLQAIKSAWGTCCGIDEIEGLEKTGGWYTFMKGPQGTFNFSDASAETLGSHSGVYFIAGHYNKPEYLLPELMVLSKSSPAKFNTGFFANLIPIWLHLNPFSSIEASYPAEHVWACNGASPLVLARIGWNYDATDTYVGLKAAGGYSSHSHLDGGSFVFDALGYRWSADTRMGAYAGYKNDIYAINGKSLFSYASQLSLRWDILCQNNYFHSTLAFTWSDGSVEKLHTTDQITNKPCSMLETYDSASAPYGGKIDLTDHYSDAASQVLRSVLLSDGSLEVIDEITSQAGHNAPFEWRMVTEANAVVKDGYVELTRGDKTMYLWCETSGNVSSAPVYGVEQEIVRPDGWTVRAWDSYQSYEGYHVVKFSATVASGTKKGTFHTHISPVKP